MFERLIRIVSLLIIYFTCWFYKDFYLQDPETNQLKFLIKDLKDEFEQKLNSLKIELVQIETKCGKIKLIENELNKIVSF